jgi:phospholipid-transporting ATPase
MFERLKNNDKELIRTVIHLAACHEIIIDEKKGTYNAASPDELALVNAAKQFGYEFAGKDGDEIMTIKTPKGELKYKLLNVCAFTSTRKRMSVIVEDKDKKIWLMCKGADSVIEERLSQKSLTSDTFKQTATTVTEFANEGLRTLYLSQREIPRAEWTKWNEESNQAKLAVCHREEKVAAVDEKIEKEMELIGSTAIEDKLQDEVADTITFCKGGGIKVWVLTGDKIETATNIGFSAGLLDSTMVLHSIEETDDAEIHHKIGLINIELDAKARPSSIHYGPKKKEAIIVAGASLIAIDADIELRELFLKAATRVDVVLACRVSPKQKADVVNLIKKRFPDKTTLSIGDGANDVSMILQAHVGVGILGKEGQQAARSADFAIGQFKYLKPLLFFHGREAYRRNSLLVLYNFYKNFLYVVP